MLALRRMALFTALPNVALLALRCTISWAAGPAKPPGTTKLRALPTAHLRSGAVASGASCASELHPSRDLDTVITAAVCCWPAAWHQRGMGGRRDRNSRLEAVDCSRQETDHHWAILGRILRQYTRPAQSCTALIGCQGSLHSQIKHNKGALCVYVNIQRLASADHLKPRKLGRNVAHMLVNDATYLSP